MIKPVLLTLLFHFSLQAANFQVVEKQIGSSKLTFVRNVQAEKDQKGEEKFYNTKADFALIERLAPLNKLTLASITAESLKSLTAEEFNQLYARLQSGPPLQGDYKGTVLQKSNVFMSVKKKILKNLKLEGALATAVAALCQKNEDCLYELIWKGKRFLPKNDLGQIEAQTLLQLPVGSLALFPMNTYCGISQIDARKESHVTDGNFADDFSHYVAMRDEFITRKQMSITEEYRMVHPGLYIGKVYSNKIFLFNVSLESNSPQTKESANACFDGSKTR
jgi:hypothetical protein